ncbi:tRNA dihydrouridine synthase [Butyrivibrio sp. M55]|uniref:tRNA dihydrouridine synthase n=1 Tax=Butyrivibrio sp. M55 TaxID=1855323 RepID=UPI0008F00794|nr:tRNA-dihydrouridine synthase family protein [Butyrivibrio sp. M55]SFU47738.1 tRNA-U20a,U20b-dihydrouridine synthase [Butyrivibrio sp. M55]
MNFYFAPMESITMYPLRNIHKDMFAGSVSKYYSPFVTAVKSKHFKNREKNDILPVHNTPFFEGQDTPLVVQIMSGNSETFLWAAKEIAQLSYKEINLNLGCPASTVVNRHKGAGLLSDPDYLDSMLSEIFEAKDNMQELKDIDISIKTRLGITDESESARLMEIYAKYPISELTVHARVKDDFYKNAPRLDAFCNSIKRYRECGGKALICYNGNIFSQKDYDDTMAFIKKEGIEDEVSSMMLGRGILENPALARELTGGEALSASELKDYLTRLYAGYEEYIPEDRNVIFKLLEHWAFIHTHFENCDKYLKAIRKARSKGEYLAAVRNIFASCNFI